MDIWINNALNKWWVRIKKWLNDRRIIRTYRLRNLKKKNKKTFILEKTAEGDAIRCFLCKRLSYFQSDIKLKFCCFCYYWHDEIDI